MYLRWPSHLLCSKDDFEFMTFWEYLLLSKVVVTSGFLGTVVGEVKNLTQGVVYAK